MKEVLTWQEFGNASRELTQQIIDSKWQPDIIIALSRGGLIPGGAIAYAMDLKTIGAINVEFYTGEGQTLDEPSLLPPFIDITAELGRRALIVDDVADSGKTLALVMKLVSVDGLPRHDGPPVRFEARSAVLYHKPRSIVVPDYSWKSTDKWISFPWSTLPTITSK